MPRTPLERLLGILKALAAIAAGLAIGLGIGAAAGALGGDDDGDGSTTTQAATTATGTATAADRPDADATVDPREIPLADGVRVRLVRATFEAATTKRGRERRRARVAVVVRLRNGGTRALDAFPAGPLARLRLVAGDDRVQPDPRAVEPAGPLAARLPAGRSVQGELRFETAGATTLALRDRETVAVRIGSRAVSLPLD